MRIAWFPMANRLAPNARHRSYAVAARLRELGVEVRMCGRPMWPRWPNRAAKFADLLRHLGWCDTIVFQQTAHASTHALLRRARERGKRIVFDIDDAAHLWQWGEWVRRFLHDADLVVAGSHALLAVARREGARAVTWIPTSVEPSLYLPHRVRPNADPLVVGWIGTHGNLPALALVREPLEALGRERRVVLRVVTERRYAHLIPAPRGVQLDLVPWRLEEAAERIAGFDIGIMPLFDDEAARCKCAFKAIEYMASGVPAVVSDVGENRFLVQDGINGFRAESADEWLERLRRLAEDPDLRARLGASGRRTVLAGYTTELAAGLWVSSLAALLGEGQRGHSAAARAPEA